MRYDDFTDNYARYSARGCFRNEISCRVWQQRAVTYLDRGPIFYTRCRLGPRGGYCAGARSLRRRGGALGTASGSGGTALR